MYYSYYYCEPYRQELIEWLENNNIRYRTFEAEYVFANKSSKIHQVYFELTGSVAECEKKIRQLNRMKCRINSTYVKYTKKEIECAQWLWLWPKAEKIDVLRDDSAGHPQIAKEPSTTTSTAFFASLGCQRVFADKRIVNLTKVHDLQGFVFTNVYLKNGKTSENIYELGSNYTIKRESISLGHGERAPLHPCEGIYAIDAGSSYVLHLFTDDLDSSIDLYATERIWGNGRFPFPLYVISNRFYQVLKREKLTGKVNLHPIFKETRSAL